MKKVLIMSASTGGGHNRAAKAIQEELELKNINGEPIECKIIEASTGGGHNRAAKAIQEELELKNINGEPIECKIIDSLKLINSFTDKLISRGYEKSAMYTPEAYGSIYRLSDSELVSKNEYKDNPLTSLLARKLKTLIKTEEPNLIIGTHP